MNGETDLHFLKVLAMGQRQMIVGGRPVAGQVVDIGDAHPPCAAGWEWINAGLVKVSCHLLDQARVHALADFRLQNSARFLFGNHHSVHHAPVDVQSVATDYGAFGQRKGQ